MSLDLLRPNFFDFRLESTVATAAVAADVAAAAGAGDVACLDSALLLCDRICKMYRIVLLLFVVVVVVVVGEHKKENI